MKQNNEWNFHDNPYHKQKIVCIKVYLPVSLTKGDKTDSTSPRLDNDRNHLTALCWHECLRTANNEGFEKLIKHDSWIIDYLVQQYTYQRDESCHAVLQLVMAPLTYLRHIYFQHNATEAVTLSTLILQQNTTLGSKIKLSYKALARK